MLKHSFSNIKSLSLEVGIPCVMMISNDTTESFAEVDWNPQMTQHIDVKIHEDGPRAMVKIRDLCHGNNRHISCNLTIHLPQIHLEELFIKSVCGDISVNTIHTDRLAVKNIEGRLNISRKSTARNIKMRLVNVESVFPIGKKTETAEIESVNGKTFITAEDFEGGTEVNAVGGKVVINKTVYHSGHFVTEMSRQNKIRCNIVSGELCIEGLTV